MKMALSIVAILVIVAAFLFLHHSNPPSITGIGVAVTVINHSLEIMDVRPNTPAARAGLVRGLIIQRIGDTSTDGKPLQECVGMMRGLVGSKVQLELVDPAKNTTNIVEFTREAIPLPVRSGTLPPGLTNVPQDFR
jgi:C-terminal processing protease CtpA/Prc